MKSKTLAFVAFLIITAFLLISVIAPQGAFAAATCTYTGGGSVELEEQLPRLRLNAQRALRGEEDGIRPLLIRRRGLEYDGTTWTDTGGGVSSFYINLE